MNIEKIKKMIKNKICAGVDEAGRGALVGRVYAAAVILDKDNPISFLTDSKKISEKKRLLLTEEIKQKSLAYSIAYASAEEIDALNIHRASLLAMQRSIANLKIVPELILVDGKFVPETQILSLSVIKGDALFAAISAASILAKTARDTSMLELDSDYPAYQFAKHKGYPTKLHLEKLNKYGVLPEHRKTYAPVTKLSTQNKSIIENN